MKNTSQAGQTNDFLTGPILPPLIRFSLPLMLSLLLQAFYGGVDLAVVGRYSPTASVSAVATGSQLMQSVTSLITGLTMGVTVLVGKAVGAGDPQQAGRTVAGQIRLFAAVSAILTGFMLLFAPQIAVLLNVPDSAMPEAMRYIRICSAGIVFITAYNGISGIFRGVGNSRSPFLFVLIACLVNVVLDLLLVGALGMDAAGAALATIIAQAVSVVFSLLYMRRKPLPFSVFSQWKHGRKTVCRILKVGSPIALQDFLTREQTWIWQKTEQMQSHIKQREKTGAVPMEQLSSRELDQIKEKIGSRVAHYSKIMGVTVGRITIRNQKTRWGSCSSKGNLNYNYQLYYLPEELLDYVVIHELAHRRHMNHSVDFWGEVEKYCPDYKVRRKRLKEYKLV